MGSIFGGVAHDDERLSAATEPAPPPSTTAAVLVGTRRFPGHPLAPPLVEFGVPSNHRLRR